MGISRELQTPRNEAGQLLSIGSVLRKMGEYLKAEEALSGSLAISKDLGAEELIWRVERNLGAVKATLKQYDDALVFYERAIDTVEGMRSGLTRDELRASFMHNKWRVYDELVGLLLLLHEKNPPKGHDRPAFEVFKRKQGRIFLEAVGKSGAKQFGRLPKEWKEKEEDLDEQLAEYQESMAEERAKPEKERERHELRSLGEKIRQAKAAQRALEEEIQRSFPDYHALKYPRPTTAAELQEKVLRADELLLLYGVMEESTALWVLSKEKFELINIPIEEEKLTLKVRDFRAGIEVPLEAMRKRQPEVLIGRAIQTSMERMELSGRDLHDLLIPPGAQKAIAKSKNLYIVPTGSLYVLPFEALIPPRTTKGEKLRFLMEDLPVAYLSSASLLKTLRSTTGHKREKPRYPLLAFANPVYTAKGRSSPGGTGSSGEVQEPGGSEDAPSETSVRSLTYAELMGGPFADLPETEEEVKEIGDLLGAPADSRPFLLRDAASRSNLLRLNETEKLREYRYLVFSCHGILPEEVDNVKQPALVLSHPDPQSKGDGFLTMADVFRLKLNADFVSLSACNTGMGRIVKGEGVIGLTRAFMYAGTPALMVNLWSVESLSAKMLHTGFYRHLKERMNRAEALRQSKLHLIHGEKGDHLRHPFFWAPSVIFGDGS